MSAQGFGQLVQSTVSLMAMMAVMVVSLVGVSQVEARPSAKQAVRFERLEVVQEGRRMTVDYVIARNDWTALQKAKVEPRMDLYLPGQGRDSKLTHHAGYTLTRNSGKVVFQRVPENLRQSEVGIRLVSAKGQDRIGTLSFGRQKGDEIRVSFRVIEASRPSRPAQPAQPSRPVQPSRPAQPAQPSRPVQPSRPAQPAQPSRPVQPSRPDRPHHEPARPDRPHHGGDDSQVAIIEACKRNTTFSSDMERCLADAKQIRGRQVVGVINACGEGGQRLSDCMVKAARLPEREAVAIVRACGQHSTFASDMSACLDGASGFRQEAAPVIEACGQATTFGSEMKQCLQITSTYRRPAAPIVRACKSASTFSSDFNKCLEQSR